MLTSQIFFDDAFAAEVHAGHPAYEARGAQDTTCGRTGSPGRRGGARWRVVVLDAPDGEAVAALVVGVDAGARTGLWERLFGRV